MSKNRVVGRGFNKTKTHPLLYKKYNYHSIHAEAAAIMSSQKGDTVIVVRIMKNGELTCSRPCPRCMEFLKDYGIKKVYFSDWDGTIKELNI